MSEAPVQSTTPNRAEPPHDRFVPTGVDAQSWIGFEQRIQERRFRALLQTIDAASARGDGIAARIALEEARELRPDAPDLAAAEARVALLPAAMPLDGSSGYFHSRTIGAFALLFVGVALLTALDFVRSGEPASTGTTMPALTPVADFAAPEPEAVDTFGSETFAPLVTDTDGEEEPSIVTVPVAADPEPQPQPERAIGTGGAAPITVAAAAPVRTPPAPPEPPLTRERVVTPPPVVPAVTLADAGAGVSPAEGDRAAADALAPQPRREAILSAPLLPRESRGPLLVPPAAVPSAPPETPAVVSASAAIAPVPQDETLVSSVLDRYARAYDALDARAAREVWPSVDERALARAFAGLESQNVSFDDCRIDVRGEAASASCRGLASYVGKVGSRQPRTEPRRWTFELRRDGDAWKIESAQTSVVQ